MYRTFEIPLEPTSHQSVALRELLDFQREVYNAALEERRGAWIQNRRSVTRIDQQKQLTGWTDERLKRFGVVVTRGSLLRVDRAFQAFFRRVKAGQTPGHPRFRSAKRFDSVEWPQADGWKMLDHRLRLQGIGHVRVALNKKQLRRLDGATPKTLVLRRRGRKWTALVVCEVAKPEARPKTGSQVGVDVGIASFVTTSDGEHINNPGWYRNGEAALARKQRLRERHQPGSCRYRRANSQIAKAHQKIANQRRDFHHKVSKQIVSEYDLIAVEDLKIASMSRRPKPKQDEAGTFLPNGAAAKGGLNKSIIDAGWGRFVRFIEYKAEESGIRVERVNPRHTSQRCHECGYVSPENRVTQAEFVCQKCGHAAHADVNAARNILGLGQSQREAQAEREAPSETAVSYAA